MLTNVITLLMFFPSGGCWFMDVKINRRVRIELEITGLHTNRIELIFNKYIKGNIFIN